MRTGHTAYQAELAFAARVAWRNSSRCIGRLYWRSLRVRDRRQVSSAARGRRRVHRPPARSDQRRPDPAADHRVRARPRRVGQARGSSAPSSSGMPVIEGGRRRRHSAIRRTSSVTRLAGDLGWPAARPARPVRRAAPDRPGGRQRRHAGTSCPPTRCSRCRCRHPELRLVRRPRAALVCGTGDQRHVPGGRRHLVPGRAVQRLVHVHRDRLAQPRRRRAATTSCR